MNTHTLPQQNTLAFNYYNPENTDATFADSLTTQDSDTDMKTIFIITPTHQRRSQKVDLTSMCHTLMHVPKVVWIVIEDAHQPTSLVVNVLRRCKVENVHLTAQTSAKYIPKKGVPRSMKPRGVDQRNAGLKWLRQHYSEQNCSGVVHFGDDDNKYDLRLFDDIRQTKHASVWKVAWLSGTRWAGPICQNGSVTSWHAVWAKRRYTP
jgi:galactosylgalactosylxylosylprotein 3-beta-glucuronosyltransferase 3